MEISKKGIRQYLEEYGAKDSIKSFAELIDERVYTKIEGFKIVRKELKLPIVIAAYLGTDLDVLAESLHQSVDPIERQHIKKINRMSNLTVDRLSDKFGKLLFKEFGEHILSYGKELLLRDKEEFYKVIGKYALLDRISSRKPLLLSGFMQLDMVDDELIFLLLSYFTKCRGDYSGYEQAQNEIDFNNITITEESICDMKKNIELWIKSQDKNAEIYNSKEFLSLVSYFNLLVEYEKNYYSKSNTDMKVFYSVLKNDVENLEERASLRLQTDVELKILNEIIKAL